MHAFRDLETAAYCPRKLYYRRRESDPDRSTPERIEQVRSLAHRYEALLADDAALSTAPIEVTPTQFRTALGSARARLERWPAIVDPTDRNVLVAGNGVRGRVHKLLSGPSLSLVFAGEPPSQGVWHPQRVRLVAAARALAGEYETPVEEVYAEYPAYGIVRAMPVDTRRRSEFRRAVRTAESIDGPPARTRDKNRCSPCEYSDECGVRTRSLRSLLP